MAHCLDADPSERFWCEITDRPDIGADLKCPQTNESGKPYWSYSLIGSVAPGDVVFHYSTNSRAFVGASVAGGRSSPATSWTPHGTVGRSKPEDRRPRPGWWLPLYSYRQATAPLTLDELQAPEEQAWIRAWLADRQERHGATGAPLQPYPERLRTTQGYLTKMPRDFVKRWPKLTSMVDALDGVRAHLEELGEVLPPKLPDGPKPGVFRPKSAEDYRAQIQAGFQVRSRKHEALVKVAGELMLGKATVTMPPSTSV